jgi:tRNA uracil 4-sulfurtransferase
VSERVCLVHYHEIGLKGHNRSGFERRLRDNIEAALVGFPVSSVGRVASRVLVAVREPERTVEIAQRIAELPGVQYVSPGYRTPRDPEAMEVAALQAIRDAGAFSTFRVDARRSNTDYAERSIDINIRIGAYLQAHTGAAVDLTSPDVTVRVSVVQGSVYVSSRDIPGIGGLPAGTSGRVVSLLSAGIDSPVATWRLIRRGATAIGVHFSGRPQTSDASDRLVAEIGEQLAHTGGLARIYIVPFGDLQREISLASPPDLRVLLYRRLMLRVAEKIARIERAKALVTGESLGQVASQTLDNMAAIDNAATWPVLRPLVGSDKLEIIADAKRIGTYEISITDHTDCCTLFMPRTPETHAKLKDVVEAWDALPHERMVDDALASLAWLDFGARGYRPPKLWPTLAGQPGGSASGDGAAHGDAAADGDAASDAEAAGR